MNPLVGAALALLALAGCREGTAEAAEKPELHVLTSLPLLFDAGFGVELAKGKAATALRDHYRLKPIDLPSELPAGGMLLAAQPRALPAEELVALDAWVRAGGKLLLLVDPLLEWPDRRPLGDRLRPPTAFADTGLLMHWGLRLDAPDTRGLRSGSHDGIALIYSSPGQLVKTGGDCVIEPEGISASCRLGTGHATIVADADLLDVESIERELGRRVDNIGTIIGIMVDSVDKDHE